MKSYVTTGLTITAIIGFASILLWTNSNRLALAHCQVPCGIYDDPARITSLKEDATTIAKAITQINDLAEAHDAQAINQAVRWINTKEAHASNIIKVVSEYFLTQKVKPVAQGADGYNEYLKKLADHHAVLAAAMKTKQNTDDEYAAALVKAIDTLSHHYHNQ